MDAQLHKGSGMPGTIVDRKQRLLAYVRLALGLLQMFGAVFAATLLIQIGLTALVLATVIVTGMLTLASLLFFKGSRSSRARL